MNLLVNGMPYRNADGFTDFESLELLNTEAIEVYKGANALRYGGSTLGGAINLETKTGYTARRSGRWPRGGATDSSRARCRPAARWASFNYYGSYTRTDPRWVPGLPVQGRDRVNGTWVTCSRENTDLRAFYFFAPGERAASRSAQSPRSSRPILRLQMPATGRPSGVGTTICTTWECSSGASSAPNQRLEVSPYFQYRDIDHPIFQVINQQSRDYGRRGAL